MDNNLIPRRNITTSQQPAEWKIVDVISEIEKLGADVLLTDAVMLLSQAKDKVSDYIDKKK